MSRFILTFCCRAAVLALLLVASPTLMVGPVGAQSIGAQTEAERRAGDPYFHEAAQYYVAEQKQTALQAIEEGLRVAPNHPKLRALRNKIREQTGAQSQPNNEGPQDEKSSQSGDSERDGSSQGDTEAESSESPSASAGERPGSPSEGENGSPGQSESDGDPRSEAEPSRQRGDRGSQTQEPPSTRDGRDGEEKGDRAGRLSRAQAERILQALEGQEKQLLREVQKREARPRRVEKDW